MVRVNEFRVLVTESNGRSRSTTHVFMVKAVDDAEALVRATQRVTLRDGWKITNARVL